MGGQESLLPYRMSLGLKEITMRNGARTEPRFPDRDSCYSAGNGSFLMWTVCAVTEHVGYDDAGLSPRHFSHTNLATHKPSSSHARSPSHVVITGRSLRWTVERGHHETKNDQ